MFLSHGDMGWSAVIVAFTGHYTHFLTRYNNPTKYHQNTSKSYIERILGECLLISSLLGKALRTLVDITRLAERFNECSQS